MMKRIEAYLKGKIADAKVANRQKKIDAYLELAKSNAEEKKCNADIELEELMISLSDTDDVSGVIQKISEQMDIQKDAEAELQRIEELKEYFNQEIKTDEE